MTRKQLKSRWSAELRPSDSPFGDTIDGLKDLRGARLPRRLKKASFIGADFSFLDAAGVFLEDCRFDRCTITSADLQGMVDHRNIFRECRFTGCDFSNAGLGYFTSRFEDCTFTTCRFDGALFRNAVFKRTRFENVRLRELDFNASGFWDCAFTGELYDVWFRGTYAFSSDLKRHAPIDSGLHGVDFSGASLSWIAVSNGCPTEGLVLPHDVALLDAPLMLGTWSDRLSDFHEGIERDAAVAFMEILRTHAEGQQRILVCRRDLAERFGEALAAPLFDHLVAMFGASLG